MAADTSMLGTWSLDHFVTMYEDGTEDLPYGPNAEGRIVYADGFMSAHLWDPDRHVPGQTVEGDLPYFSYCGSWQVEGETVRHHVHAATEASWTGKDRLRTIRWHGPRLELTAERVVFAGKRGRGVLIWRRGV